MSYISLIKKSLQHILFAGCISAAIADNPFPDNARLMSTLQVSAIDLDKFMYFSLTISIIILYI
jgi:hypothetical protein